MLGNVLTKMQNKILMSMDMSDVLYLLHLRATKTHQSLCFSFFTKYCYRRGLEKMRPLALLVTSAWAIDGGFRSYSGPNIDSGILCQQIANHDNPFSRNT